MSELWWISFQQDNIPLAVLRDMRCTSWLFRHMFPLADFLPTIPQPL